MVWSRTYLYGDFRFAFLFGAKAAGGAAAGEAATAAEAAAAAEAVAAADAAVAAEGLLVTTPQGGFICLR